MTDERLASYHEFTRRHGLNRGLYRSPGILQPFFLVYFALSRQGRKNSRIKGGIIVAANHRSFLDPFVIGACLPWNRPMNYVAKVELFEKPWQALLPQSPRRLSDPGAGRPTKTRSKPPNWCSNWRPTAIFPEGTRIRTGSLGTPKRGVGRLAMRSGAPAAGGGQRHPELRRGWRIRPRR